MKKTSTRLLMGISLMIVSFCLSKHLTFSIITPIGIQVLGIFVGTIYLWMTIDPTVASLLAIAALSLSDYGTASSVLTACIGNATVVQMLFMMIFMSGLSQKGVTQYIARFLITRKIIEHRPWLFSTVILTASYLLSVFVNVFLPVFLFWPVLYEVFKQVGYLRKDSYPQLLISAVGLVSLIGFPVPPYMGNALVLIGNYRSHLNNFLTLEEMERTSINNGQYFIFCFSLGIILIISLIFWMRFIVKPNVEPLKNLTIDMIQREPLPKMSSGQKIYGFLLIVFILAMLLPSLFPNALAFINKNSAVVPVILVISVLIVHDSQKPLLSFEDVMGKDFSWSAFWLCSSAILLGGAVTNERTGITAFISSYMAPFFEIMSSNSFAVVMVISAVLLTNLCNSLIIGLVLQPIVMTYCDSAAVNPVPYIILLNISVLATAFCTPAANPIAAMVFSNTNHVDTIYAYKYAFMMVCIVLIVILASIPVCIWMFG